MVMLIIRAAALTHSLTETPTPSHPPHTHTHTVSTLINTAIKYILDEAYAYIVCATLDNAAIRG